MPAGQKVYVYLVYGLVAIYALCYNLQSPLEPFLVDSLVGKDKQAESAVAYGRLQSFFGVVQMVGSACFGNLIDRFGVRVGFVVNFLGCALTYLTLANTTSLTMLYLSKVPGVAMAGFLCAQAAVSQLTPNGEERVAALGRLTTAYTLGGVIGPYAGGLLGSEGDYFVSAKIAVVGCLLAAGLSLALPAGCQKHREDDKTTAEDKHPVSGQLPWAQRAKIVMKIVGFLTLMKLVTGTANSMARSSQSTILKNQLSFSEADMGFFMSCQYAFGGFANCFLLAPVTRLLGGHSRAVVKNCIAVMGIGYFLQAGLTSQYLGVFTVSAAQSTSQTCVFIGMAMVLSIFQYSLGTSITAESTQLVPEDMKGTLIGIEHSIFSAAYIITPSLGITIMSSAGVSALYACVGSIFLACFAVWTALAGTFLPSSKLVGESKKSD